MRTILSTRSWKRTCKSSANQSDHHRKHSHQRMEKTDLTTRVSSRCSCLSRTSALYSSSSSVVKMLAKMPKTRHLKSQSAPNNLLFNLSNQLRSTESTGGSLSNSSWSNHLFHLLVRLVKAPISVSSCRVSSDQHKLMSLMAKESQ